MIRILLPQRYGKGKAIIGPQGTGKTTLAVQEVNRARNSKLWDGMDSTLVLVKHPKSNKCSQPQIGNFDAAPITTADEIAELVHENTRAVFIDGIDNIEDKLLPTLVRELILSNRLVYCIGNNLDYNADVRNETHKILALCDEFWQTQHPCEVRGCTNRASRTQDLKDEAYRRLCLGHFPTGRDYNRLFNSLGSTGVSLGNMFCGKTSDIGALTAALRKNQTKYLIFKPVQDDRYIDDKIVAHDHSVEENATNVPDIEAVIEVLEGSTTQYLFFDEGMFLKGRAIEGQEPRNMFEFTRELMYRGYKVHHAGLFRDYRFEAWPGDYTKLLCLADEYRVSHSLCVNCMTYMATESQRIIEVNGKRIAAPWHDETEKVGGTEAYEPRCRPCMEWPDEPARRYDFPHFDERRNGK